MIKKISEVAMLLGSDVVYGHGFDMATVDWMIKKQSLKDIWEDNQDVMVGLRILHILGSATDGHYSVWEMVRWIVPILRDTTVNLSNQAFRHTKKRRKASQVFLWDYLWPESKSLLNTLESVLHIYEEGNTDPWEVYKLRPYTFQVDALSNRLDRFKEQHNLIASGDDTENDKQSSSSDHQHQYDFNQQILSIALHVYSDTYEDLFDAFSQLIRLYALLFDVEYQQVKQVAGEILKDLVGYLIEEIIALFVEACEETLELDEMDDPDDYDMDY